MCLGKVACLPADCCFREHVKNLAQHVGLVQSRVHYHHSLICSRLEYARDICHWTLSYIQTNKSFKNRIITSDTQTTFSIKRLLKIITLKLKDDFIHFWIESIHNYENSEQGNKLRIYRVVKTKLKIKKMFTS